MPQIKMENSEMERFARTGAALVIAQERRRHIEMDKRFPGILAEAIRSVRANGAKPEAPAEERKPRTMSAAARKRISLAQKRRWAKQRKEAKAS